MPDILVIGCGNPLRGDDGVGWYCVDELMKSMKGYDIEFVKCRELTPELSEELSRANFALFIDSSVEDGDDLVRQDELLPSRSDGWFDTHRLEPSGLLSLSEAIYGNVPRSFLLSVRGQSFEYEERISDAAADSIGELVSRAHSILMRWLSGDVEWSEPPVEAD